VKKLWRENGEESKKSAKKHFKGKKTPEIGIDDPIQTSTQHKKRENHNRQHKSYVFASKHIFRCLLNDPIQPSIVGEIRKFMFLG
jgi:hypothetical protein